MRKVAARDKLTELSTQLEQAEGRIADLEKKAGAWTDADQAAATEAHGQIDKLTRSIEDELKGWQGKSASDAVSAMKSRDKADAARATEGFDPSAVRLARPTSSVARATKRIIEKWEPMFPAEATTRANDIADRILGGPDGRLTAIDGRQGEYAAAKKQFRALGIAAETLLATRLHANNEISDLHKPLSRFERGLAVGSDKFAMLTGITIWTDIMKTMAGMVASTELLHATKAVAAGRATKKQITRLAESGIDGPTATRIWQEFSSEGGGNDLGRGTLLANTGVWTSPQARLAFEGGLLSPRCSARAAVAGPVKWRRSRSCSGRAGVCGIRRWQWRPSF